MNILPFGQTVYLWRRHRALTQEALARLSGIARPNLSAIEQGKHDVSLNTLRALALGLQVRPGVLVDGQSPETAEKPHHLSREALERVARAVAEGRKLASQPEKQLAEILTQVTHNRRAAARGKMAGHRQGKRDAKAAWLSLEAAYSPQVIESLLSRIQNRLSQ